MERRNGNEFSATHMKSKKNSFNDIYNKHKKIFLTDNLEKILKENYLNSKGGYSASTNLDHMKTADSIRRLDTEMD